MKTQSVSETFLKAQVHWVMSRGLPAQEAEDLVVTAWETANKGFDPERGSFASYLHQIIRNDAAYWWRKQKRTQRAIDQLRLLPAAPSTQAAEQAAARQEKLLRALDEEEEKVFHAWALQKHLGKGRVTSVEISASLAMTPADYENAKRRLKVRLHTLLKRFGWSIHHLLHGDSDVA